MESNPEVKGLALIPARYSMAVAWLLREDAEEQQCLVVLLHAVPFDFTHDQLP